MKIRTIPNLGDNLGMRMVESDADSAPVQVQQAAATPAPVVTLPTPTPVQAPVNVQTAVPATPGVVQLVNMPSPQTSTDAPVATVPAPTAIQAANIPAVLAPGVLPALTQQGAILAANAAGVPTVAIQGFPVPNTAASMSAGAMAIANALALDLQNGNITQSQFDQAVAALAPPSASLMQQLIQECQQGQISQWDFMNQATALMTSDQAAALWEANALDTSGG